MKFAAIDIGSNAVRLLFGYVIETNHGPEFTKAELIRIPLRLGEDAFIHHRIGPVLEEKFINVMQAFKLLIDAYGAISYRACATSAMREAENAPAIIQKVADRCGLKIEIISGRIEAETIYANHVAEHLDPANAYLYIDVGGGSTELTLFHQNQTIASKSFDVGTIRWLHQMVSKEYWAAVKSWVRTVTAEHAPLVAIGSGGNINKIFKMLGRKENKPLTYTKLRELYDYLKAFTIEDRIRLLGLRPDRADVIVPAAKIFLSIMKHAQIEKIIVPQIGLSDGLIHQQYEAYKISRAANPHPL